MRVYMVFIRDTGFSLIISLAINLALVGMIPFFSKNLQNNELDAPLNPIALTRIKPTLKEKLIERKIIKPPEPLEKIEPVRVKQQVASTRQPKINISLPVLSFDINPKLSKGMTISAPPVVEKKTIAFIPTEFSLEQLDKRPRVVRKINPIYPYAAKRRKTKGKVIVKFLVDKKGVPQKFEIINASPKGVFEESVLSALANWRFSPGIYQGKPVAVRMSLPFSFSLKR
jgi:periplasmic protein TonB